MASEKYIMWISEVDFEDEVVFADGHRVGEDSSIKFELTISMQQLQKMVSSKDYSELINCRGRIFTYEKTGNKGQITLEYYEPLTEEQILEIQKTAEEISKNLNWE